MRKKIESLNSVLRVFAKKKNKYRGLGHNSEAGNPQEYKALEKKLNLIKFKRKNRSVRSLEDGKSVWNRIARYVTG